MLERDIFRRMCIVSDKAEGYHRSIAVSKQHARSSAMPYLLATNRLDQNLRNADQWIATEEGAAHFRYNFTFLTRECCSRGTLFASGHFARSPR